MKNIFDFNLVDLGELCNTALTNMAEDNLYSGCLKKPAFGNCGSGCGCGKRNGQCGGWIDSKPK